MERYITKLIEEIPQARAPLKVPPYSWDEVNLENEYEIAKVAFDEESIDEITQQANVPQC